MNKRYNILIYNKLEFLFPNTLISFPIFIGCSLRADYTLILRRPVSAPITLRYCKSQTFLYLSPIKISL